MTILRTQQKIKENYKKLNFVKQITHGLLIRMSVEQMGGNGVILTIVAGGSAGMTHLLFGYAAGFFQYFYPD